MLLEQTNHNILKDLQFNRNENCIHQIKFKVPYSTVPMIAHCIPTCWDRKPACFAIIRDEHIDDALQKTPIKKSFRNRNRLDLLFKVSGDGYWDWFIPAIDGGILIAKKIQENLIKITNIPNNPISEQSI